MLCIPLRQYKSINTTGEKVKHSSQNVRPSLQNIVFSFLLHHMHDKLVLYAAKLKCLNSEALRLHDQL